MKIVILYLALIFLFTIGACGPSGTTSSPQELQTTPSPSLTDTTPASSPIETTTQPPTNEPTSEIYQLPVFTVSPIEIDKIDQIVTLGNLNPPGHTFPTDHIYFYMTRQPNADRPDIVDLYSPGDLTITQVWASEHVTAGFTDYNIIFKPCPRITIMFYHVSALETSLFGDTSSFTGWNLDNEYTTGGETYRLWSKDYDIPVNAGDLLGKAGGNPGQWALDLGLWDEDYYSPNVANPQRWENAACVHALCPLILYETGPLLDSLIALVVRDEVAGEEYPWGEVMQDIPGTAQGCWFLGGTVDTYPEDPHLALVHSNIHPAKAVLSVGTSVPGLESNTYEFTPLDSGFFNRDFKDITPDGNIYGFRVDGFNGIIIVWMPDKNTLYIEVLAGATENPDSWSFTNNKVVFVR